MVRSSLFESFASQYNVRFLTANVTPRTDVLHPVSFSILYPACITIFPVYFPHLISVPQMCRHYQCEASVKLAP